MFFIVDGNWGLWGTWSECLPSCGNGTQTRTRLCNNPIPKNGGAPCIGNSTQKLENGALKQEDTKACANDQPCPSKFSIISITMKNLDQTTFNINKLASI